MGQDLKGKELRQRNDGRYEGRYVDKFGKRKSIICGSLRDLKVKIADAEYENRKCLNVVDEGTVLDEWYEKWMRVYKIPNIRQNTKRHYASIYHNHISPVLGDIQLTRITKLQIQSLINEVKEDGYQWETQNKVRVLLKDMFNCAMEDQFVSRNPCRSVKCASRRTDNEPRYLTREEQALFFECCAGRWYDNLFNVAINTGLRPGELAALTWDNIDLRNMVIHVEHTLVYQKFDGDTKKVYHLEDTKTTKSNRKMPINATDYSHAISEVLQDINEMLDPLEQIEPFSGQTCHRNNHW